MKQDIRVAVAQFETRDGDKQYNLSRIAELSAAAKSQGAQFVLFHEMSITAYTYVETLDRAGVEAISESLDASPSVDALIKLTGQIDILISAGLVELEAGHLYNCQVVVSADGLVARHRKIHEFISPHISCGDSYTLFDALGARWGMLTCYDNNLPENARMTAMNGAEILLAPHVTGCLPSPAPGRGVVAHEVWRNRKRDPVRCRMEFDGPKARGWITKWLPARAWENGLYLLYSNVIGEEGGTVKPGGSMVIDPYGEIMAECRSLEDEVVCATLTPEAVQLASGSSYIRARRPDLYGKMLEPNSHLHASKRPEVYWQKIRENKP